MLRPATSSHGLPSSSMAPAESPVTCGPRRAFYGQGCWVCEEWPWGSEEQWHWPWRRLSRRPAAPPRSRSPTRAHRWPHCPTGCPTPRSGGQSLPWRGLVFPSSCPRGFLTGAPRAIPSISRGLVACRRSGSRRLARTRRQAGAVRGGAWAWGPWHLAARPLSRRTPVPPSRPSGRFPRPSSRGSPDPRTAGTRRPWASLWCVRAGGCVSRGWPCGLAGSRVTLRSTPTLALWEASRT